MDYIISQILGGIATVIILTYTIIKVSGKTIIVCNFIINLLWSLHYYLLGADTGFWCSMLCSIMCIVFYLRYKVKFLRSFFCLFLFFMTFIIFGIITWDSYPSIIQIFGNILIVIALWFDNDKFTKFLFIFVGSLWIAYNLIYFSYIGIIAQILSVIFNLTYIIINIVKYLKAKGNFNVNNFFDIKTLK
jgi:hypothetical protein